MVQAIIDISENANQVINVIKAKYNLKDKSEAINMMAHEYAKSVIEKSLRPDYIAKALRIKKQKGIKVNEINGLRKRHEILFGNKTKFR